MRYVTVDDVLYLHALEVGAGVPLRDRGLLDSAVARPMQSAFGEDAYPTVPLKAAALLQSLAQNQAFEDGNKRVAVLATLVFLALNGVEIEASDDEIVRLMLDIAVVPLSVDAIADVLDQWSRPAGPGASG